VIQNSKIRVAVAENSPPLRDGIIAWLENQPDMQVVGAFDDAWLAFAELRHIVADVLIVDSGMPQAIELMQRVQRAGPQMRMIALVNYEWDNIAAIAADVSGSACLAKDKISSRLLALIRCQEQV
jgi:DNA-binding NarL/FixJ family response regulator